MKGNESNFAFTSPKVRALVASTASGAASRVERFDRSDLDAEPGKTDVGAWIVGAQPDRGNPEVAQDLGAQSDFTPLALARIVGAVRVSAAQVRRHARRAVAQIDEGPASLGLETVQNLGDGAGAENIAKDISTMQPRRHVAAIADRSVHESKMQDGIEWRAIRVTLKLADGRLNRKGGDPLDQLLARLPIGDEIRDRNALDLVLIGEGLDLGSDHHGAVVIGELADHGDRRQARKLAKVDGGLGMAGAHEHAPILGDKGKDMAGTDEVARAHIAIGEGAHRIRAL